MLREKRPHKPAFVYDIARTHSLKINTDLIEYDDFGDTKGPLLRSFFFISMLKARDNVTTGQYINFQTFDNLQFRRLVNFISWYSQWSGRHARQKKGLYLQVFFNNAPVRQFAIAMIKKSAFTESFTENPS